MTLLQGIINAFVMFLARIIAYVVTRSGRDERGGGGMSYLSYYITVMVLQTVLMVFGSIVVAWFSRYREFRADVGGAQLAGKGKMVGALKSLQSSYEIHDEKVEQPALQAFKISNNKSTFLSLFATHPPLEKRIQALQK